MKKRVIDVNKQINRNTYIDKVKKIKICPECECTMIVTVMLQDGYQEMEKYFCPNKPIILFNGDCQ